jgi:predicted DCC family thiol-disulfide oxidoreductase YuxK
MHFPENTSNLKKPILFFDGECNLCHWWVQFVIRRDRNNLFFFSSLQSQLGRRVSQSMGLSQDDLKSLVLIDESGYFLKSSAALRIFRRLGLPWAALSIFLIAPCCVRDAVYDFIARNRYRWFGRKAVCLLPNKDQAQRFLS